MDVARGALREDLLLDELADSGGLALLLQLASSQDLFDAEMAPHRRRGWSGEQAKLTRGVKGEDLGIAKLLYSKVHD